MIETITVFLSSITSRKVEPFLVLHSTISQLILRESMSSLAKKRLTRMRLSIFFARKVLGLIGKMIKGE